MHKYALNYWNIKNAEDLDPAVKLILEALSLELYNLSNDIKDSQVRILEKVAGLLAPDFLTAPNPAHAILHATPVEPTEWLTNATSFVAPGKLTLPNEMADTAIDVFFTPVDTVQVFDVQMVNHIAGGHLFSYDPSFHRQLVVRAGRGRYRENNMLWLGLKTNPKLDTIENLSFYFDWKNIDVQLAQHTHQLLPLTKWYLDEREIEVAPGIPHAARSGSADAYESIFPEYDLLSLMERDIKYHYDQKFISIRDNSFIPIQNFKKPYPPSFKTFFSENELQNLKEPLVWIKVVFPATLQPDFLTDLYVYPNAFPVMNRQLNDLKYRLKGGSNIVPLKTDAPDLFLSMKSLTDDTHKYKWVPYGKTEEEKTGTFMLRKGGVERFDERNARDLIGLLLELLRNESAAFAAYGYDFIATTLKEMNQKISLMEQKTRGYLDSTDEIPNYIIVKPFANKDMMYAEYWSTLAGAANGIRAGTKMQQVKGVKVKQDPILLLTTTTGGKARLRPEERLTAFRYGIMTRNRIITKEDIRAFCFFELGNRIQKVAIERGFALSVHEKEAFIRTIDVLLTPAETEVLNSKEWQVLCEQLRSKLQSRSGVSNNYRVLIQNP